MDEDGGEMGTLNQNGQLPVEVTVWHPRWFASGHDTYAYRVSLMYVHVEGGAWICNISGGAIESPGNTFRQLLSGWHWQ